MMLVCAAGRRIHGYVRDDEWHDGEHGEWHHTFVTCQCYFINDIYGICSVFIFRWNHYCRLFCVCVCGHAKMSMFGSVCASVHALLCVLRMCFYMVFVNVCVFVSPTGEVLRFSILSVILLLHHHLVQQRLRSSKSVPANQRNQNSTWRGDAHKHTLM